MSTRFDRLATVWLMAALLAAGSAAAQPPDTEPPPAPVSPVSEGLSEEAAEQLEAVLEEVEERIEVEIRESLEFESDRRDDQRRAREIRAQVRRRVREASNRSDSKVSFGSSIHIDEDEVGRDLVTIGGNISIDGDVYGDAIAVGGSIEVDGKVTGDVVAVGGGVDIGPNATILGEVTSVGGLVTKHDDAEVLGRINEVSVGSSFLNWDLGDWGDWDRDWHWGGRPGRWGFGFGRWVELGWELTFLVMLALVACLVQLIGGDTVERVRRKAIEAPFVAGLVGLAIQLLFVPVLVVLCVILTLSIIGIPLLLLIPFVFLAMLFAWLVGYTGAAMAVGRWFERRFDQSFASPFMALLVGIAVIQSLSFISEVLDFLPGFLWIFAFMFGLTGFLFQYAAWTVGLGAVFLNGFRRSPPRETVAPQAPPPPPAPQPPAAEPPIEASVVDVEEVESESAGEREEP